MKTRTSLIRSLLVFAALGVVHGQNVVATARTGKIDVPSNPALVTFVASSASTATEAAKTTTISAAEGKAVAATAAQMVPIPVVGPLAGPVIGALSKRFHKPKPVTGFTIAFLKGLTAGVVIPRGEVTFVIPAQSMQPGAKAAILRVKPELKDSQRIVRSLHVLMPVAGGTIVVAGSTDAQVLGVDEDVVASHQEIRDSGVVVKPDAVLDAGEYAVVMIPAQQDGMVPVGLVWDFKVL